MANNTPKNNTGNLLKHAQSKSRISHEKVELAIKKMIKNKELINFNSVAAAAKVSKPFLYNNKEIRERIETLRKQQENVSNPKTIKRNMSDQSKDALIEILRMRIKDLEMKNKELTKQLQQYLGNIYEQI
ncbi:DUF6262 family protein [Neobacillus rhizophilus]|uniref:Transposase n=1 Tax=Neobacillus rhizophilus TaxID=2833579 RepID=A0A942YY64_9BACI|nr:DUF6262 family protein [Neobacillus rhizophilus]MBS4214591.1 transposase [Neobacillus rhizophilus]